KALQTNNENAKKTEESDELYIFKHYFYDRLQFGYETKIFYYFYQYKNGFLSFYENIPLDYIRNIKFMMIEGDLGVNKRMVSKQKYFYLSVDAEKSFCDIIKDEKVEVHVGEAEKKKKK
ncbi:hypothetical protein HEP_00528000, partial [Hepatocystis sp. ex Piliocolobus tephrosceles]